MQTKEILKLLLFCVGHAPWLECICCHALAIISLTPTPYQHPTPPHPEAEIRYFIFTESYLNISSIFDCPGSINFSKIWLNHPLKRSNFMKRLFWFMLGSLSLYSDFNFWMLWWCLEIINGEWLTTATFWKDSVLVVWHAMVYSLS